MGPACLADAWVAAVTIVARLKPAGFRSVGGGQAVYSLVKHSMLCADSTTPVETGPEHQQFSVLFSGQPVVLAMALGMLRGQ